MFHQNNIVLIGSSVAEQSKSIKHLNKRVINIDYFNDEDLIGENYRNPNHFGFVNDDVISILKKLNLPSDDTLIIVSSDYKRDKDYYKLLTSYGEVIGNHYKDILKIQDHKYLSSRLKENNINFPKRYNSNEEIINPALVKNSYLSGGSGVKIYKKNDQLKNNDEYYEQFIEGQVYSIIFISNYNKNYEIIGINKIFSKKTLYTDFCFSGAYSNIDLDKKQIKYLKNMISFFIKEFNLIGINGIDFIISNDIYFLEINPRITQTCFLYDRNFTNGYIAAHIDCVLNKNLPNIKKSKYIRAFENLYAASSSTVNIDLGNFDFVTNIPKLNNFIDVGDPICTINSESNDEKKVKNLLLNNISLIKKELINIEII